MLLFKYPTYLLWALCISVFGLLVISPSAGFRVPQGPISRLYNKMFFHVKGEKMCVLLNSDHYNVGCGHNGYDNAIVSYIETESEVKELIGIGSADPTRTFAVILGGLLKDALFPQTLKAFNNTNIVGVYTPKQIDAAFIKSGDTPSEMYPGATGLNWAYFTFSLVLLDDLDVYHELRNRGLMNKAANYDGILNYVEQDYSMTAFGLNATRCLEELSCAPIGSHSVWGATKPVTTHRTDEENEIIVVTTKISSTSMFHDLVAGGKDVIGPLSAVLSVIEELSTNLAHMREKGVLPVIFSFFVGEEYNRMGSQRFWNELRTFHCNEMGYNQKSPRWACINPPYARTNFTELERDYLRYVIEVGPISTSLQNTFAVTQRNSAAIGKQQVTLNNIFKKVGARVVEVDAFPEPSSVLSFPEDRARVILRDFEKTDSASKHQTIYDSPSEICVECVRKHADVLLQTLSELTGWRVDAPTNSIRSAQVEKWIDCFTIQENYTCPEVAKYLKVPENVTVFPSTYYPGVFSFFEISKLSLFLQLFIADKFSIQTGAQCSDASDCQTFEMCVRGTCTLADAYLQNTYSPSIEYNHTRKSFRVTPDTQYQSWTESYWPEYTGSRLFKMDTIKNETRYFFGGLVSCVFTVLVVCLHNYARPLLMQKKKD